MVSLLIQLIIFPIRLALSLAFTLANLAANHSRRTARRRRAVPHSRPTQRLAAPRPGTATGRSGWELSQGEQAAVGFVLVLIVGGVVFLGVLIALGI